MREESILGDIRQISSVMDSHCRSMSERGDLTPTQFFCIMYINEHRGKDFCSTDLCDILGTSRASVSLLLKGLKQKGYLRMSSVEGDDRKKQLELTPKAIEFTAFLKNDMDNLDKVISSGISPEDILVISRGLKIILANLKQYQKGGICRDKDSFGTDQTV
ncbi:MAG: MarR family winged helix-turn-helix transcriptional regulator [Oscillospiraceae bacterium]